MKHLRAVAMVALAACGSAPAPRDAATAAHLDGVWNATFSLDHAPAATASSVTSITGAVALLKNYGTYDVDFAPFGFTPRESGAAPTLVITESPSDSIGFELADSRHETVLVLRGRVAADSISGEWAVYIARDAGGRGRFVMRRR